MFHHEKIKDLNTPCILVDEKVVKNNCKKMIDRANQLGVGIRPHMKTHKTIEIGKYQVEGLKDHRVIVSTLSEAQFFTKAFKDILYAIPISPNKIEHAYKIHCEIDRLHLMIDHIDHIKSLVHHFQQNKNTKPWSVFLKIDCGYHRAGANPESPDTVKLVDLITNNGEYAKYFEFQGIYSHSGHSYKCTTPQEIKKVAITEATVTGSFGKKLILLGYPCPHVSIGSTPVCCHLPDNLKELGVTEIHPGNYVFYDLMQMDLGNCLVNDVGVSVLTTIISVYPDRNEFLVDAGSLALSSDPGCTHLAPNRPTPNFGIIVGHNNLRIVAVTQEIGKIVSTCDNSPIPFDQFKIGSKIRVIPNHSCLTAAMFSHFHVLDSIEKDDVRARSHHGGWA